MFGLKNVEINIVQSKDESFTIGVEQWCINNGKITITDNVEKILNGQEEELNTIIAHEASHLYNRDNCLFVISVIFSFVLYLTCSNFTGLHLLSFIVLLVFFAYALIKIKLIIEIRADIEAASRFQNPEALIKSLYTLYNHKTRNSMKLQKKELKLDFHPLLDDRKKYLNHIFGKDEPIHFNNNPKRPCFIRLLGHFFKILKPYLGNSKSFTLSGDIEYIDCAIYVYHKNIKKMWIFHYYDFIFKS